MCTTQHKLSQNKIVVRNAIFWISLKRKYFHLYWSALFSFPVGLHRAKFQQSRNRLNTENFTEVFLRSWWKMRNLSEIFFKHRMILFCSPSTRGAINADWRKKNKFYWEFHRYTSFELISSLKYFFKKLENFPGERGF